MRPALIPMKAAIALLALAGVLLAGAAAASPLGQEPPADEPISCTPLIEPVCLTYYHYCRNYLGYCPVD